MLARNVCIHCYKTDQCTCSIKPAEEPALTWRTMSARQKVLTALGYLFAGIIAVGCGVSTAAAFITLNIMTMGLPCYLITGLIFVAGFAMNWYINKNAVPGVLVEIFGKGRPFQSLMEESKNVPLSKWKKVAMGVGVLLALSVGFTNGVLTYAGTFSLTSAFGFLAVISPALPWIAAILAGVTLVCLTAVMLKNIALLVRTKDVWKSCKDFLYTLFSIDPSLPHNRNKSKARRIFERSVTVFFTFVALPLAAFGLYMTMNASAAGAKIFLLRNIPQASLVAVEVASKVISLGFALLGRIPFTVRNIFRTLAKVFTKEEEPQPLSSPSQPAAGSQAQPSTAARVLYVLEGVALHSLCVVNAVGNGLISVVGGGGVAAGIGGSINSLVAGASNIHLTAPSASAGFPQSDAAQEISGLKQEPMELKQDFSAESLSSPSLLSPSVSINENTLFSPRLDDEDKGGVSEVLVLPSDQPKVISPTKRA